MGHVVEICCGDEVYKKQIAGKDDSQDDAIVYVSVLVNLEQIFCGDEVCKKQETTSIGKIGKAAEPDAPRC